MQRAHARDRASPSIKAQARKFLRWRASQEPDLYDEVADKPAARSLLDDDRVRFADSVATEDRLRRLAPFLKSKQIKTGFMMRKTWRGW